MDTRTEVEIREALIAEARSWVGVRFRHMGKSRTGVDCAQLQANIVEAVLPIEIDRRKYSSRPTTSLAFEGIRPYAKRIAISNLLPGDIVLMNYGSGTTHYAFFTGSSIIHASMQDRKVIEQPWDGKVKAMGRAAFRLKGVQ